MNTIMDKCVILFSLVCITLITACESDQSSRLQDSLNTPVVRDAHVASFDPNNSVIPFPNNLLLDVISKRINIPVEDPTDFSNPQAALNTLDGFSTISPISTSFSTSIDSSTIIPANVRMFEVALAFDGGPVVGVVSELTFSNTSLGQFVAALSSLDTSNSTLVILPTMPLKPKTSYMVVLTNGIKAADGKVFGADTTYALAKSTSKLFDAGVSQVPVLSDADAVELENLRLLVSTSEATVVASTSLASVDDIILSWSFTTQSISDVLAKVLLDVQGGTIPASFLIDSGVDSNFTVPLSSNADIYVGTLTIPYFLTAAANDKDPAPLNGFWKAADGSFLANAETTPAPTNATLTIPLMVSIPKSAKPAAGWKTVIFQHGITSNRTSMLAIADTLAAAGLEFAVVAIDMPLHGLTGSETNGTKDFKAIGLERHFDLDLVNNDTNSPGSDSNIDSSGQHFINLSNLLVSRDNVRQSVSDLFNLTKALEDMNYDGVMGGDFDLTNIYFVGHSLGGIVGSTFLALEPSIKSAVLGMSGGGIAKLLDGSATFGPRIAAGLFQNGVVKGTADYESFMGAAQTILDSGDPINYTTATTWANRGVLLFEVVGGNSSPSDLVIPNMVPDTNDTGMTIAGLLSGTDPIATLMGLVKYDVSPAPAANLKAWVRYSAGDHSSLLSPVNSLAVITEMQNQMAIFLVKDGTELTIIDNTVIAPNP